MKVLFTPHVCLCLAYKYKAYARQLTPPYNAIASGYAIECDINIRTHNALRYAVSYYKETYSIKEGVSTTRCTLRCDAYKMPYVLELAFRRQNMELDSSDAQYVMRLLRKAAGGILYTDVEVELKGSLLRITA